MCSFIKDACGASKAAAAAGTLKLQTALLHKYLQTLEVEVTAGFGGTDSEPVLVSPLNNYCVLPWCIASLCSCLSVLLPLLHRKATNLMFDPVIITSGAPGRGPARLIPGIGL